MYVRNPPRQLLPFCIPFPAYLTNIPHLSFATPPPLQRYPTPQRKVTSPVPHGNVLSICAPQLSPAHMNPKMVGGGSQGRASASPPLSPVVQRPPPPILVCMGCTGTCKMG